MAQTVNVAELAFTIEDLLRPLPREAKSTGERAKQFNNLGNVVIVFAVFSTRLGVKEVVACYEFENLEIRIVSYRLYQVERTNGKTK